MIEAIVWNFAVQGLQPSDTLQCNVLEQICWSKEVRLDRMHDQRQYKMIGEEHCFVELIDLTSSYNRKSLCVKLAHY